VAGSTFGSDALVSLPVHLEAVAGGCPLDELVQASFGYQNDVAAAGFGVHLNQMVAGPEGQDPVAEVREGPWRPETASRATP
jgi:hypothetical protein